MTQQNWLPEQDRAPTPKRAHPGLGVTWDQQQSQMYAEWLRFEASMEAWSNERYHRAGVGLTDADKSFHRRNFEQVMIARYGSAYPDVRWAEEHEAKIKARQDREAQERGKR